MRFPGKCKDCKIWFVTPAKMRFPGKCKELRFDL